MFYVAPTVVMSPAHCYFDTTPAIETVIPLYYTNATAQIGRRVCFAGCPQNRVADVMLSVSG